MTRTGGRIFSFVIWLRYIFDSNRQLNMLKVDILKSKIYRCQYLSRRVYFLTFHQSVLLSVNFVYTFALFISEFNKARFTSIFVLAIPSFSHEWYIILSIRNARVCREFHIAHLCLSVYHLMDNSFSLFPLIMLSVLLQRLLITPLVSSNVS